MTRWLKFSVVGGIGVGVQLAALTLLLRWNVHYLAATALAVEIALLHNYVWHKYWTWAGREKRPGRLVRFHVANGLVSLVSNLIWMRVLTGWLHMPPLYANLIAITATAALNFALGDRWVFADANPGAETAARTTLQGARTRRKSIDTLLRPRYD